MSDGWKREDKALLIGCIAAGLSAVGGVLTGDVRFGELATVLIAVAGALKAYL